MIVDLSCTGVVGDPPATPLRGACEHCPLRPQCTTFPAGRVVNSVGA